MTKAIQAPIVLEAQDVRDHLSKLDALGAMRALFTNLGQDKAVQPAQTVTLLPGDSGDFITYMGASAEPNIFGAKLSPYLPQTDDPIITAWTLLMSAKTGRPLMLCDSGELTTLRTAATTALAVDLLARAQARTLAIIGAGSVARAHLEQVKGLRDWDEIRVFAPSLKNENAAAKWTALDERIRVAGSAEDAAKGADVVMLCTSSGTPVLKTEAVAPNALVTSISTNVANAHEIEPTFLMQADVYCDCSTTTPSSAGEMKLAAQAGWSPDSIRGDLAGLVCSNCPAPTGDRPVFFRSIGLGLEDIFMAHSIYNAATC
ncbi:ornithine cyclodeaminase family protein [Celeribacter sp.]|uniref:ornithine cyclodeaminase family protein n=1 Tax=Celeribacter sp. TaxID=1890673 RepID=UPI003A90A0FC